MLLKVSFKKREKEGRKKINKVNLFLECTTNVQIARCEPEHLSQCRLSTICLYALSTHSEWTMFRSKTEKARVLTF